MRMRGHKWSQATVWAVEKGERGVRLAESADLAEVLAHATSPMDLLRPIEQTEVLSMWGRLARVIAHVGAGLGEVEALQEALRERVAGVNLASLDPALARGVRELTEQTVQQIFFGPAWTPIVDEDGTTRAAGPRRTEDEADAVIEAAKRLTARRRNDGASS